MKTIISVLIGIAVIGLLIVCFPNGCSDPDQTTRVLEQQGYTDIEITGWRPLSAGKGDVFSTGFRARSQNGSIVTGVVTRGMFKGNTIRID